MNSPSPAAIVALLSFVRSRCAPPRLTAMRANTPVKRRVLLVALTAVTLAGCGNKDQPQGGGPGGLGGPGGQALPVSVIEAQPQGVPVNIEAVGQSEGSKEVQVRARVSGILLKQRYTEGDRVKAGAVLFLIDPAPYEIALAQAQAALAQARATLDQSQREEDRLKPLAAEQAISGREYDTAISTRKTSQAQGMARQADVRGAELNLGYTKVIAPISGVTGRAINSEGSLVTAGTDSSLLTTISQTDPIWVRFSFAEQEYNLVRANEGNAKVRLIFTDGRPPIDGGKLNFAASTVDRTLGTIQLRAEIPNSNLAILPGQFVRIRVTLGTEEAFLVPQAAVSTSDQGKSVWVVGDDGRAAPRPVEVGQWQGTSWIVKKGLKPGYKVIIDNIVKLRPGAPVSPHPLQSAPAGGPGQQPAPGQIQQAPQQPAPQPPAGQNNPQGKS